MHSDIGFITILPLLLFPAARASVQTPQPDPLTKEIVILQKQLLVLRKLRIETQDRLEKSADALETFSTKLRDAEAGQRPDLARRHSDTILAGYPKSKPGAIAENICSKMAGRKIIKAGGGNVH